MKRKTHIPIERRRARAAPKPQTVPVTTRAVMYTRSKMIVESSFA